MPGPAPKPDELRRRRNLDGRAARLERRTGDPPPLPPGEWLPEIAAWWEAAWRSQMASRWHLAEVHVLARYLALWQMWAEACDPSIARRVALERVDDNTVIVEIRVSPDASILAAMVTIEDRFGLSSVARRRLSWEIEDDNESATRAARPRLRRPSDPRLKVLADAEARRRPIA